MRSYPLGPRGLGGSPQGRAPDYDDATGRMRAALQAAGENANLLGRYGTR